MPIVYVDEELQAKLKRMAKKEGRSIVALLRHLVGVAAISEEVDVPAPEDPEEKWEWTKKLLGVKCGCTFNDEMKVDGVTDWGLFRTINNSALMDKYLLDHPEERDKYAAVVEETTREGKKNDTKGK